MIKLIRYLKCFKKEVTLGPIFKLTEAIFEVIVPLVMASIIDVGIGNKDANYVLKMGGVMILLGVTGLICALICQYFAAKASQGVGTLMRNELFTHINTFSHTELDKIGTPSLITRLTNDVNQLQLAVAMLIRLAVRVPFLIIGSFIMAMMLDVKLSLIFIVVIPIIAIIIYCIMSKSIPYYKIIQGKLDRIGLITRENLEGIRVIRAFSKQNYENDRFEKASDDLMMASIKVGKISALLNPLTYLVMNFAIIAILWCGGWRVNAGVMSQGEIIAFVNYMTQILLALMVLANLVIIFTKAAAAAQRVNEVFEMKPSIEDAKQITTKDVEDAANLIEFKDVSFTYTDTSEYAIKNVSFKVQQGEMIGIIGGTGSGKSTLVNLITRFYDVTEGQILVAGKNVKDYGLQQLRKQIGVVPQNVVLFAGTIRDNLRWQQEDATDEDLTRALEIAQALEFVQELPDGYNTPVLQGGKNFSGGQRQRLTIARGLVGSPKILILDDSASALDYVTESKLRKALKEKTKKMTTFIVSQRISSIKHADQIIVLDDGKVVGLGKHEDLLETCHVYKEIYLSQVSNDKEVK